MPKRHRNPFIPHERALETDQKTIIYEKESKEQYTRQQAKLRREGAPQKQRVIEREKEKEIASRKAGKPPEEE